MSCGTGYGWQGPGIYHNGAVYFGAPPPPAPPAQVPGIGLAGAHRYTYWPQSSPAVLPSPVSTPDLSSVNFICNILLDVQRASHLLLCSRTSSR
jgi:hypothetical protein